MNWKRICTGGGLAGVVFLGIDFIINHLVLLETWRALQQSGAIHAARSYAFPVILLEDFGIGFILMWLYALARPRLGPGPKTALTTGTLAWFLLYVPHVSAQWLWYKLPLVIPLAYAVGGLIACWVCTYLAGWQYIEKAP